MTPAPGGQRNRMKISRQLSPSQISTDLHGNSLEEALAELSQLACSANPGLQAEKLTADLLEREGLLSTASGFGLAFPHCYESIDKPAFALGIHRSGIEMDAHDTLPVTIFIVVISPEDEPETHLEALSAVSKLFMNEEVREKLLQTRDKQEILNLLREFEESQ